MEIKIKNKKGAILKTANTFVEENISVSIDSTNLLPENIKSGISILGVEGTHEGGTESGAYLNIPLIPTGETAKLWVERVTTNSYVGSTAYTNDSIIALSITADDSGEDITIKYNGEVMAYDQSGTFRIGKYGGVEDGTASSGWLEISGGYTSYGAANHSSAKYTTVSINCIKKIENLGKLTVIAAKAFSQVDFSEAFIDLEKIDSIEASAFDNNSTIRAVRIPDKFTEVNSWFSHCENLWFVHLPNALKIIGDNAFIGCSSLTNITIPDTVETIGAKAFEGCINLSNIVIPNNVTSIGANAFCNTAISEISWPVSVQTIPEFCFMGTKLESFTLPGSVVSIGQYAFSDTLLPTIHIPATVENVSPSAFAGCYNLTSITIDPNNSIYESGFNNSALFEKGTNTLSLLLINTNITAEDLSSISIKSQLVLQGLVSRTIKTFTIPSFVKSISGEFFPMINKIEVLVVPDTVETIEITNDLPPFNRLNKLIDLTIPFIGPDKDTECNIGALFKTNTTSSGQSIYDGWECTGPKSSSSETTYYYFPERIENIKITGDKIGTNFTLKKVFNKVEITKATSIQSIPSCKDLFLAEGVPSAIDSEASIGSIENLYYTYSSTDKSWGVVNSSGILSKVTNLWTGFRIGESAPSYSQVNSVEFATFKTSSINPGSYAGYKGLKTLVGVGSSNSSQTYTLEDDIFTSNIIPLSLANCPITTINTHYSATGHGVNPEGIYVKSGIGDPTTLVFGYNKSVIYNSGSSSFTKIGDYAFFAHNSLQAIPKLGNNITEIGKHAFDTCSNLLFIDLPPKLKTIGESAFYKCTSLAEISLPSTLEAIGNNCFYDNTSLTYVDASKSKLETIESQAFYDCQKLSSIDLPETLLHIEKSAFYNNKSLTSIQLPTTFKTLAANVFTGCINLKNITLGTSLETIPNNVFSGCSSLTSVIIPNSVTSIGSCAFEDCNSLTNITIPDSVTSIDSNAFNFCSSLENVTIGNGVTNIGYRAFYGCERLTSITIPDSVTSIGSYAFDNCSSLTNITLPFVGEKADGSGATNFGYIFGASHYNYNKNYVPSSLKEVVITGGKNISANAFNGCSNLTSIILPETVETIGSSAFKDCSSLVYNESDSNKYLSVGNNPYGALVTATQATIKDTTKYICGGAFSGKTDLTNLTIPDSVTSIGDYAFSSCSNLASIEMSNSVAYMGDCAFSGCSSLTSIEIPDNVTSIGYRTFYNCNSLTNITIPNNVVSIGKGAFYGYTGDLVIPASVTTIDGSIASCNIIVDPANPIYDSRDNCGAIIETATNTLISGTSTIIPASVTAISSYAFEYCSNNLDNFVIPNNIISIGDCAFSGCRGLTSIEIPNSVETIGEEILNSCFNLTSATFNTDIPRLCCLDCSSLVNVYIADGVTSIGYGAFAASVFGEGPAITTITIPSSVTNIGEGAFNGCKSLATVTMCGEIPPVLEGDCFYNTASNLQIIVPSEAALAAYQAAPQWSTYKNKMVVAS